MIENTPHNNKYEFSKLRLYSIMKIGEDKQEDEYIFQKNLLL